MHNSRLDKSLRMVVPGLVLFLVGLGCGFLGPTVQPASTPLWNTPTEATIPAVTTVPTLSPSPTAAVVPTPPEPFERGTVLPDESVQGTLPLFGTDVWRFDAPAGQYVTIRMDAVDPAGLDTYLELYDADGVLVAEDDDSGGNGNSLIAEYPVVVTSTYTIHALTYSGAGNYFLSVRTVEPSGGGVLWYGAVVEGMLVAPWSRHTWTFDGAEGYVVNIAMNATDGVLDCFIEFYAPDGVLLTTDDDSGIGYNALIEYYTLPAEGTYRVVVRGGEFGSTGTYVLALVQTELVVQGTLAYSDTVDALLEPGTRHHWVFEGEAGDVVSISMTAASEGMDTYLELFAPGGVRVMVDDDGGAGSDAAIVAFELPLSGIYRIIARGHDDEDVGEYQLTLMGD
jgi:catechol 2,3-dioxygenase-like lactoylglutathione lyase family enzyme